MTQFDRHRPILMGGKCVEAVWDLRAKTLIMQCEAENRFIYYPGTGNRELYLNLVPSKNPF